MNECSTIILTDRGFVSMKDVNPGDNVFSSRDGHLMEVESVIKLPPGNLYTILYNDGRITVCHDDHIMECILDNGQSFCAVNKKSIKSIYQDMCDSNVRSIRGIYQHRIEWPKYKLNCNGLNQLDLDPYVAGPLLIYGDIDDPYVNLPMYLLEDIKEDSQNLFSYMKSRYAGFGDMITDGKVLRFTDIYGNVVPWVELFGKIGYNDLVAASINGSMATMKYFMASINDRLQFVRGVFDVGFRKSTSAFSNHIIIEGARNEKMMREFRSILSSLGILVHISHHRVADQRYQSNHTFDILSDNVSELFYNRTILGNIINNSTGSRCNISNSELTISKIGRHNDSPKTPSYDIRLSCANRHEPYLTANMLSRVSI